MIKYMIMNKDLTEVYVGTTVYDDEQWANKQLGRLQCSENWSVRLVNVDQRVSLKTAELDLETMLDSLPQNRILYKDSGLWMIIDEEKFNTTDKMLFQVARYQQTTKETFAQFIKRCFDDENEYYITE